VDLPRSRLVVLGQLHERGAILVKPAVRLPRFRHYGWGTFVRGAAPDLVRPVAEFL
jgi:hypothetical protein